MDQYFEYQKQVIIDAIKNTKDKEKTNLIYGMLMNSDKKTNQAKYPSAS